MGLWAGWKTRKKEANTEQVGGEALVVVIGDALVSDSGIAGGFVVVMVVGLWWL